MSTESVPHPFRRDGLRRRLLPFGGAAVLGAVTVFAAGEQRIALVVVAFSLLVLASLLGLPWERLPRWVAAAVPLIYLTLIVLLRTPHTTITFAPLLLLPLFWFALHGTRAELTVGFVLLAGLSAARGRWGGGFVPGELIFRLLALGTSLLVCLATQALVQQQRRTEQFLRSLLEALPVGISVDRGGEVVYANPALARLLGDRSPSDRVGQPSLANVPPERREWAAHWLKELLQGNSVAPQDVPLIRRDGGEVLVEVSGLLLPFDGQSSTMGVFRDVSDERWLEAAQHDMRETMALEREQLDDMMASIEDGVVLLEANRSVVYANLAYFEMFATLAEESQDFRERFDHVSLETPTEEFELRFPQRRVLRRSVKPLQSRFLVVWQDVTAQHDLMTLREEQALIDPLTGIANRRAVEEKLRIEVERARRQENSPFCVALFDIDHFKKVNDLHGHAAGDEVLRQIGRTLAAEARSVDIIGRWGGEEFIAILPGSLDGGRAFCERARLAIAAIERPVVGAVTVSAGITEFVMGEEVGATLERADARLYQAKRDGRNRVAY